jgi:hypothetical protein
MLVGQAADGHCKNGVVSAMSIIMPSSSSSMMLITESLQFLFTSSPVAGLVAGASCAVAATVAASTNSFGIWLLLSPPSPVSLEAGYGWGYLRDLLQYGVRTGDRTGTPQHFTLLTVLYKQFRATSTRATKLSTTHDNICGALYSRWQDTFYK